MKNNIANIIKWIIIGAIVMIVYRCIRQDSQKYETFTGDNTKVFPASQPAPEDLSEKQCGDTVLTKESSSKTCGGEGGCVSSTGTRLLPVLDPCYNMREICKQSILLEDHCFQSAKRCSDCIIKHFLTLEALSEEAITLDKGNKYKFSKLELPEKIRKLEKDFLNGRDPEEIAQDLRQIRKPLMNKYFDRF